MNLYYDSDLKKGKAKGSYSTGIGFPISLPSALSPTWVAEIAAPMAVRNSFAETFFL
jgi:hypothetical protein